MDRCLYATCCNNQLRINSTLVGLANTDLYPEKYRLKKRLLALAASVLLPLGVAVCSWGLHLHTSRPVMADNSTALQSYKVPNQETLMASNDVSSKKVSNRRSITNASEPLYDEAIEAFLSIYQLDRYGPDFQRALGNGRLSLLSQRIYGETGYRLVQLKSVPDVIRRRYGALAFSLKENQPPMWLLFWKPQLELKRFYANYRGREIRSLQRLLAEQNLYQSKIDGIVGPKLTSAVVAFQKQLNLPTTGFPDDVFLFLLSHQQKGGGQWPKV